MKKIVSPQDLASLCTQLSYGYASGTSIDQILELIKGSSNFRVDKWITDLKENQQLSIVLEKDGSFPEYFIAAFRIAEKVGQEEKMCTLLASHFTRISELKSFLKESLSLPLILLGIFSIVLGIMSWSILPLFQNLLFQLGVAQSAGFNLFLTELKFFSAAILFFYVGVALFISIVMFKHKQNPNKYPSWENTILRLFPKAQHSSECAYFTSMAHMALAGGIENRLALEMIQTQDSSQSFNTKLQKAKVKLHPSEGLYELLLKNELYEPIDLVTMNVAAKSGRLEIALDNLAQQLTKRAYEAINQSLSKLEPWLITLLTLLVFAIIFAMILPLLNVLSSLG